MSERVAALVLTAAPKTRKQALARNDSMSRLPNHRSYLSTLNQSFRASAFLSGWAFAGLVCAQDRQTQISVPAPPPPMLDLKVDDSPAPSSNQLDNLSQPSQADQQLKTFSTESYVCPHSGAGLGIYQPGELESLAIDLARRVVLAYDPKAGKQPIQTVNVEVRSEGELVHLYARVKAESKTGILLHRSKPILWDVSATLIYRPSLRRVVDLNVKTDGLIPYRVCPRIPQLVTALNDEFDRLDPFGFPTPKLNWQLESLPPRTKEWIEAPLQGQHAWHVLQADRYQKTGR